MSTNDLPPVGTLWGDIPPEVRERLPAGTRLDAIPGREWSLPITRMVHGGWFDDLGTRAPCDVHPARPILSYPTDAGTWDEPRPFATGTFADFVHPDDRCDAHTTTPKEPAMPTFSRPFQRNGRYIFDKHGLPVAAVGVTGGSFECAEAEAERIVKAVNEADTPKEPAMNDDKIPPRPWAMVNGHVRDYLDRHVVGVTSIRWTIEERDAIIEHIVKAVNSLESRDIVEQDRWQAHRERDAAIKDRDEARAEVARLRAVIVADLPTYPRASHDEPGVGVKPPPGWEWAGEWFPSGAMTANGVPVWRRAVRKVAK